MIVAPLCLDNEEIKERSNDTLLFEPAKSLLKKEFYVKGLAVESDALVPLTLLVPHIRS